MPINITLFLDGRPGHEKQSQAVAVAIADLVEVAITTIVLEKKGPAGRLMEYLQLRYGNDPESMLPESGTDMVIGTGSRTHLPLVAVHQRLKVPAITCMAPEWLLRRWFDLCLIPRHDGLPEGGNVMLTDGPPVLPGPRLERDPSRGVILVGGVDDSSHHWDSRQIVADIGRLVEHSRSILWTISSSPRTPKETLEPLADLARRFENVAFYHYADTPRGWVEQRYAESTYALVTADSISMMYEAITAGCRVGILPVKWKRSDNKFQRSIDYLHDRGLIGIMSAQQSEWPGERYTHLEFNEAKRCAQEIVKRFCDIHGPVQPPSV
jgi:uncharacterized protein